MTIEKILFHVIYKSVAPVRRWRDKTYFSHLEDVTLISNNCIATFLYQHWRVPYASPTINLQIPPTYFLKFCENLQSYLSIPILPIPNYMMKNVQSEFNSIGGRKIDFPVGLCGDIPILFQHEKDLSTVKEKFQRRISRINFNKICYIFMADSVNDMILNEFYNSSLKNKIILSNSDICSVDGVFCLHCGNKSWYDYIYSLTPTNMGKRYFQQYDFAKFFANTFGAAAK